jgi:hypothetical protein
MDINTPIVKQKARSKPADQSLRIQDDITQARRDIEGALADEALLAELTTLSFSAAVITNSLALVDEAQKRFTARQVAIGKRDGGIIALRDASVTVTKQLVDFRDVTKIAYPTNTDAQRSLGATGRLTQDHQKLATHARASYAAARQSEYTVTLAAHSYNSAVLASCEAGVDALDAARVAADTLSRDATQATQRRDAAVKELRDWLRPFRRAVRRAEVRLGR